MEPSRVQHFPTPKRCLASMNTSWRFFVRNSETVIPEPFSLVFETQTLWRTCVLENLTTIGLGLFPSVRPNRYAVLMFEVVKSATSRLFTTKFVTTLSINSVFFSSTPWNRSILRLLHMSIRSTLRVKSSTCFCNVVSAVVDTFFEGTKICCQRCDCSW